MKALILLFLPLATILAAGPGIPLEGKFKEMAQDGVGKIWAVSAQDESSVVSLDGRRWLPSKIKGLPDGARLLRLQALVDRDVGCLWSANSDQDQWIVTRHKGGDSWLWTKFSAKLREPQMLGCSDGSMLLTERGPTLIKIPKDGGTVTHITIDTGSLIEPKKQSDGEVSKDFAVFRAMEDSLHQLWIWNPAREKQLYYPKKENGN